MTISHKIIFLDIDGPMVPAKAQLQPGNGFGLWNWNFDPFAVNAINFLGWADPSLRIVLSSHRWGDNKVPSPYSHLPDISMREFWETLFEEQGLKVPFHEDWLTVRLRHPDDAYDKRTKYQEVMDWLLLHPEVTHFTTLEDDLNGGDTVTATMRKDVRLVAESYDEGLTWKDFTKMHAHLGIALSRQRYREYNDILCASD